MRATSRKGGIIAVMAFALCIGVGALVIGSIVIANNINLRHQPIRDGERVRLETPFGGISIDARDNLDPVAVGVPIYPGAIREHRDNKGGVLFDFENAHGDHHALSVVAAEYSTSDSPDQVREFYKARLPHWIFTERHGHDLNVEYSQGGYKRIVAINQRDGRTHIGIASVGESGVN
jgi:hypothetical protein